MSVLIKDIDKELYRKFKAKAILKGIKVGTALSLAIEKWLQEDDIILDEEIDRIKNNETYDKLLPTLLKEHKDEWILISDGKLLGIFNSQTNAFEAVGSNNLYGKVNLITKITKQEKRVVKFGIRRRIIR